MCAKVRSSAISRFAGAIITVWLCGIGAAWAGTGGSDGGVSQPFLDQVCQLIGVPTGSSPGSCIKPPTLTQIILAIAGYQNTPPDFVRGPLGNTGSSNPCSVSGTPFPLCSDSNAVTTANPPAPSSIALSDLSSLTPLAFNSQPSLPNNCPGQATPVALGTNCADSFVYPVLSGPDGQHTLDVVFDYTPGTSKSVTKGQAVGSFTFPLVRLNADNSETPVVATLNLTATCNGVVTAPGCLAGTVTGIPGTGTNPPPTAAQLGIQFGFQFAASPNSLTPHEIITLQLPVVVIGPANPTACGVALGNGTPDPADCGTDAAYFGVIPAGATLPDGTPNPNVGFPTSINQYSGQATAFTKNDLGFTPTSVGRPIGVSPYPAPLCPATGCPSTPTTFYGFCATIAGTPAAATFVEVGTDATVYASSPVGQQPQCPSM
jgi:hypothetical protein